MHNQKNTRLLRNVQNLLFHLRLTEWSVFPLILVVPNPKYFSSDVKKANMSNKNALQGTNVRTSCISLRTPPTNKHSQHTSTHRKARLEPPIRDAQKLAQNVFPPVHIIQLNIQLRSPVPTGFFFHTVKIKMAAIGSFSSWFYLPSCDLIKATRSCY